MKEINYEIAFYINGTWSENYTFRRPIVEEEPLDEVLDTGLVDDVAAEYAEMPPFTLCRIAIKHCDGNLSDTLYMLSLDCETEAVTLFTD